MSQPRNVALSNPDLGVSEHRATRHHALELVHQLRRGGFPQGNNITATRALRAVEDLLNDVCTDPQDADWSKPLTNSTGNRYAKETAFRIGR